MAFRRGRTTEWVALPPAKGYALAIVSVAIVAALRLLIDPWIGERALFLAFTIPVLLTAIYGGVGPALLVWGRIVDGRAVLEPAFRIVGRTRLPERPGPYSVEGTASDGSRLFGLSFDAAVIADHPRGGRTFAFTVPLDDQRAARLAQLRLGGPGVAVAVTRAPAALRAAPAEPVRMAPASGGLSLQWDAVAHPMVMVRDARTGEVLSFARGGSMTVATGAGELELIVSDGVQSRRITAVR